MLRTVVAASVAAFAFVIGVLVHQNQAAAAFWVGVVGGLAGVVGAAAAVWAVVPRPSKLPVPPEQELPSWVVDRPAELDAVVTALVSGRPGTVGITTGLYGAGGFGKTTLAKMVSADRRIRKRFGKFVYPVVTVGQDVRSTAAIAAKVNDVIKLVAGENATFTDPQLAGAQLGSLLDAGPPRLLIIDDVWEPEQLAPFLIGGKACTRLVTTRVPELIAGRGPAIPVDQMSDAQARTLLTAGLPPLDEAVVANLLEVTGRWPLLLRLVNKILADYAQLAGEVDTQGATLVEQLCAGGPAVVDEVLGEDGRTLDVGQPSQRERAVRATIEASTGLLRGDNAERFAELGVFTEDETIPSGLVAQLWRATAGLDGLQAAHAVSRLTQLSLVSQPDGPGGDVAVHDVIRDFLRARLGQPRLARLHGVLLDAIAAGLPPAGPLDHGGGCPVPVAWWELGGQDRYVWNHLIKHLCEAGRAGEAEAVACDLRWVGARLERFGPAAPAADLFLVGTPRAARLRAVLGRMAHLLAPTEPDGAVIDVLHSRVADDPDWGPQVAELRDIYRRPRLVNRWPLPDLPDPALRRVLVGHTDLVFAVAVAPDGSWLASAGQDETVRIWDAATGRARAVLSGHVGDVYAVAVAPDGSWLASGGDDRTVRIWDAATGRERAVLSGHAGAVRSVAVAPDGSWLASGGEEGTVRIWDAATGRERVVLSGHVGWVHAVAVAPDGSWLASASVDAVRIWDAATGRERAVLSGHAGSVQAVAVAPDGSWLASASVDETVRIWDAATGRERAVLSGHTNWVQAVAVAPDGSWLASASEDETVRIWDAATWQERAVLSGHTARLSAVAVAPDGSWLASGSWDWTVRIWDAATRQERAVLKGHTGRVFAVAVAPDGSWLASGQDRTVRIWDAATGQERAVLADGPGRMQAVAVAPDGSWLVSGGEDATVRIWDAATGRERAVLSGHDGRVYAVAVAPDGSWLASGCGGHWLASRGRWDGTALIWDAATGQKRAALAGHGQVFAVAVAPDGSWLASGGEDATVRIWDAATGRERAVLSGHAGEVQALAVAPDGSWLASGSVDRTVRIWDTATGQERAVLAGHITAVWAVAVAPDGNWLASSSWDGTVRIWDAATGRAQAMMRVDNNITTCAWLGTDALVLGGSAGLYLFGFLASISSATADHRRGQQAAIQPDGPES